MTNIEKKIAEIREALEKATPGRWIYDKTVGDVYSEKTDEIICCASIDDAHLIANAPEWLRFLLNELEMLKRERDRLIDGLRWYADTKNYEYRTSYLDQDAPIIDDSGQLARDILKEIGELKRGENDEP